MPRRMLMSFILRFSFEAHGAMFICARVFFLIFLSADYYFATPKAHFLRHLIMPFFDAPFHSFVYAIRCSPIDFLLCHLRCAQPAKRGAATQVRVRLQRKNPRSGALLEF